MPVPGHIGREHADLAVGDLARRPRILPAHTAGALALLEKAGLVDHQNRIRIGQRLDHVVAHEIAKRIWVPASTAEKSLLAPGARITGSFRPHPARLPPLRTKQGVEEQARRMRHALLQEQRPHPRLHLLQRRGPKPQRPLHRHPCRP